jgi:hypothetical protein
MLFVLLLHTGLAMVFVAAARQRRISERGTNPVSVWLSLPNRPPSAQPPKAGRIPSAAAVRENFRPRDRNSAISEVPGNTEPPRPRSETVAPTNTTDWAEAARRAAEAVTRFAPPQAGDRVGAGLPTADYHRDTLGGAAWRRRLEQRGDETLLWFNRWCYEHQGERAHEFLGLSCQLGKDRADD